MLIYDDESTESVMLLGMNSLIHRGSPTYEKLFIQVIHYINGHFTEDITLEEVADQVFLNSAYFSRLFKQELGVNFTEYVTNLRMNYAKSLLHSGKYKAYEVSEMAGYRSSQYFNKVFKEFTGFTPIYYSRRISEEE